MLNTLATIDDLQFAYRLDPALRIPRWQWRRDQHWAVVGGNGAGKSTLAKLLRDELRPQRGSVQLAADLDPRGVLYVSFDMQRELMEHDNRYDDSDQREDAFDVGTSVRRAILQDRAEDAEFAALVEAFGIGHILHRGIRFISTGEGRKTLLARALLSKPSLLILDNPLEGLDRTARGEFIALLERLLGGAVPILLLLSLGAELPRGITHVLELEHGEVVYNGPLVEYETGAVASSAANGDTAATRPLPMPLRRTQPLAAGAAALDMAGVSVSYHDEPVLTDIHWRLERGRHCCISGRNGAGKSTLLSLICGDNHKAYGQPLWLFGRKRGSGESIWEIKANCGVVNTPLQLNHLGRQRALEVVASGLYDTIGLYQNCSGREKELTLAWIAAVGLEALADHRFDQLSFGEQRTALLARAMVKSPPLLILDEPCLGLDEAHRRRFLALADRIAAQGHTQILYVSHEAGEIPSCINQWLQLLPHPEGGSTAVVSDTAPA